MLTFADPVSFTLTPTLSPESSTDQTYPFPAWTTCPQRPFVFLVSLARP